jgi:hypothetical protein
VDAVERIAIRDGNARWVRLQAFLQYSPCRWGDADDR